jgi:putative ABC transport system permease protein
MDAWRNLLRSPGYTSAAVLTLALAIGAVSGTFAAVQAVLLNPLPIQRPEDLIVVWGSDPARSPVIELSYKSFEHWAAHSRSFDRIAAIGSSNWPAILESPGDPTRLSSAGVSSSFFETLGATPLLGRVFSPDDDIPNAEGVVVLSHSLWQRRFGGLSSAIGTRIRLDEGPRTVVGVMPAGFDFPHRTDLWIPVVPVFAAASARHRIDALTNVGVLYVIGRLRHGMNRHLATEELDRLARDAERTLSIERFGATGVIATPFLEFVVGPVRHVLWALLGAVSTLLAISCATISGLMLTRLASTSHDEAVRIALGATRMRLGRLWLFEAAILSAGGGSLGLLASLGIAGTIRTLAPDDVPRLSQISITPEVLAVTCAAVLGTALLSALAPIRHAATTNLVGALSDSTRGTGRRPRRGRWSLSVVQIALSVMLLIAAGLLIRSFSNLRHIELGFSPAGVLLIEVSPRTAPIPNEWIRELLNRVEALPHVESAGAVVLRPLALGPIGSDIAVALEGQPDTPAVRRQNPGLNYQAATPGYFPAMGIDLKRGRLFTTRDDGRAPRVAVVSESAARRLWPGQDPIGKRLLMPSFLEPDHPQTAWRTIVGVVSDVRYRGLDDVRLDVYDPALQSPIAADDLVVRGSGDLLSLAAAVQAEARRLDPGALVENVTTLDAIVSRAMAPWRFGAWLFSFFAVVAFVLATAGLFSVVSLDVSQRRHEFAVRMAVGAQARDVVRSVLMAAGWRVLAGVAIGVLGAVGATRALRSVLFGIEAVDVTTYLGVVTMVCVVVATASYMPARRAAGVDPLTLLKRA